MGPAAALTTSIVSHGEVDKEAREVYGTGPVVLRIGNGGAGATGLVKALAEAYLSTLEEPASIEWVCNHSRNTQLALLHGYIDIALTYERDQEALAASEGWSRTVGCAFHDHFCLAGPSADPAGLASVDSLEAAFSRIALSQSLFHSRADSSATMWKERNVWFKCGLRPWDDPEAISWYKTSTLSPADALRAADGLNAYLLTDRSTLLRQTTLGAVKSTTVFFEPQNADSSLMNSCYALVATSPSPARAPPMRHFLEYLASDRGQAVITQFGSAQTGGFPFFAPVKDEYARTFLRGGMPKDRHWVNSLGS